MKLTKKEITFLQIVFFVFLTLFIVFRIVPIIYTFWRSLVTINQGTYILQGLNAYVYVLKQKVFWQSIMNSLSIALIYICINLIITILIGEWIISQPKMQIWLLRITYVPTIIGSFVYAILFRYLLDSNGVIVTLIPLGNILNSVIFNQFLVALILLWTSFGITLMMYLNRRKHLGYELIEFSLIEGASRLQRFWYVILPHTKSVILLIVLLSTIEGFTEIEIPMNLTFGGPQQSTVTFGYLNYLSALVYGDFAYASASTVIFSFILFILILAIRGVYEKNQKLR